MITETSRRGGCFPRARSGGVLACAALGGRGLLVSWSTRFGLLTLALGAALASSACLHARGGVEARPLVALGQMEAPGFRPTQMALLGGFEVIVDYGTSVLRYRPQGSDQGWATSPVQLYHPHAVAIGSDGAFYVADTDNHAIVRFADLSRADSTRVTAIAGQPLSKPHDIVLEPRSGLLYVVDANARLYRLRGFGVDEAYLQLDPAEVGYARSLSVVRGTVYVVGSSKGLVVRVDDFASGRHTLFASPGKKREASSGSWESTGLVLNDVEFFAGYWYGSNFFTQLPKSAETWDRYGLLRWRSWSDFERGRWEDLGPLIPGRIVPYYFFAAGERLYLACLRGAVYVLTPAKGSGAVGAAPVSGSPPR
jgi:hypothetical protein